MSQLKSTVNQILHSIKPFNIKRIGMLLMLFIGNELRPEFQKGLKRLNTKSKKKIIRIFQYVKSLTLWNQPRQPTIENESMNLYCALHNTLCKQLIIKEIDSKFINTFIQLVEWQHYQGMNLGTIHMLTWLT